MSDNRLSRLSSPALNILGTLYRVIQSNITDTDNLMKLLAEEKEIVDKPDAEELKNAAGELELDHVSTFPHHLASKGYV